MRHATHFLLAAGFSLTVFTVSGALPALFSAEPSADARSAESSAPETPAPDARSAESSSAETFSAEERQAADAPFDALYRQFTSEILFCADLEDSGSEVLIASGEEKPLSQSENTAFGAGFRGKCLINGTLRFSAAGNVLPASGTLLFWMRISRPEGVPDPKEPNFWPVSVEFEHGQMLAGKQDVFNNAPIYAYLQGHPDIPLVLVNTYSSTKKWRSEDWHLAAVCWRPGELKISLDGGEFVTDSRMPPLTGTPRALELRAASHPSWAVALDEVLVLNRPLTSEETEKIYVQFQK